MKLITFLGATQAYETIYVFPDGREHRAPFFGVALAHFYLGLDMRVFVTEKAREEHLEHFTGLVNDHVQTLEPVDIPDGANDEGLWGIFRAVIDAVDEGEEVIFDITHGFRSLPFLSFLAAAYLRVVKDVNLRAVLYGNFEARYGESAPYRAPVIDLTPFVSLLDWMISADRFVRFGDARDLAMQLRAAKPDYHTEQDEFQAWRQAGFDRTPATLETISLAMRFVRPYEAMAASERLGRQLHDVAADELLGARPFQPLIRQIIDSYAPLALTKAQINDEPVETLAVEREMVHWYLDRNQSMQAVALAREWIVSWAMLHLGMADLLARESRFAVETAFGGAIQQARGKEAEADPTRDRLLQLPHIAEAVTLYEQLGDFRNDLLHAGKRAGARSGKKLAQDAPKLCCGIDQLPLPA